MGSRYKYKTTTPNPAAVPNVPFKSQRSHRTPLFLSATYWVPLSVKLANSVMSTTMNIVTAGLGYHPKSPSPNDSGAVYMNIVDSALLPYSIGAFKAAKSSKGSLCHLRMSFVV